MNQHPKEYRYIPVFAGGHIEMSFDRRFSAPDWLSDGYVRYIAHTICGRSIRDLARECDCHASTISRQVRRVESLRDDPLVDAGLTSLESTIGRSLDDTPKDSDQLISDADLIRVLRRLCETGAVLAVADGLDTFAVMRSGIDGQPTKTASVTPQIAQRLALMEWVRCTTPGRVRRYSVTSAGRVALGHLLAKTENTARVSEEAGTDGGTQHRTLVRQGGSSSDPVKRNAGFGRSESPLVALSRKKDRDGNSFLGEELVRAGERLREDFELSQMSAHLGHNWSAIEMHAPEKESASSPSFGVCAARRRVAQALSDLGPGLSDVALRCCCFLEGLEVAERQMGWSARSGKIVLRIALQRLRRHYAQASESQAMIG